MKTLTGFVTQANRAVRLKGEVNILVTSSAGLRQLNRRFRGKNRSTDVLSFPAASGPMNSLAGDIAISADIATRNAARLGHSAADEVKILALHGLLHLAGYDHERDHGKMARKEQRLRESLGLPVGLIERSNQGQKLLTAKAAQRALRKAGSTGMKARAARTTQ